MNVDKFIHAEFEDKGRGPGYDCHGLTMAAFEFNYGFNPLPDFSDQYKTAEDWKGIGQCIESEKGNWKKVSEPQEGAVIVFNIAGHPHHIGICTGKRQGQFWFLHIYKGTTAKHERLNNSAWKSRIGGIYVYE